MVIKYSQETLIYLYSTSNMVIQLISTPDKFKVRISAGASCAPGGDRSRTGVIIIGAGAIVHWASHRQPCSVLSVHKAKVNGAVTGTKIGIAIMQIVQDMTETTANL